MSHLRAPAARADRREGGRHGRPVARATPPLPETHIRPQLLRLAVLPPVAVALSGCAAVLFIVRTTTVRPGPTLWAILAGTVGVALAGIVIAAFAADRTARSVGERIGALRRNSARGEADLRALVEALRRGEGPPARRPRSGPPADADDFELLAADLARARDGAMTAVVHAAQLSSHAGSEQKVEVFVNLARRLQSLVHREISILDELENEIEDPDLLKGLFHVDHLATRIRRHAENLAVLGGAVSRRQWSNPVSMTEVLRSAIAEVEQYSRVKLVPPIDGTLRGHAVADVIHLLAELVENATVFSAPHTQVLLRANLVTSGLAVEVEDRGLGMPVGEQSKMNALLADPDQVNVASLLQDGRIGLFVVSQLARRHGIHVRLQTNIYGGVQAVLVVPQALLGTAPGVPGEPTQARPHPQEATGALRAPVSPQYAANAAPVPEPAPVRHSASASVPGPAGGAREPRAAREPQAPRRDNAPSGASGSTAAEVGRPAPLPMRGARPERPTPAEALPGVRPEHRPKVDGNTSVPPTPRAGTVRGTMGKPQLPRRRAHEHLAPQLRGGPAPLPRPDADQHVGHDPGLMAAFQRGIGLAEAAAHRETGQGDPGSAEAGHAGHPETAPGDAGHRGTGLGDAGVSTPSDVHARLDHRGTGLGDAGVSTPSDVHTRLDHRGTGLGDAGVPTPSDVHARLDVPAADVSPAEVTDQGVAHLTAARLDAPPLEGAHMDAVHTDPARLDPVRVDAARWDGPSADVTHIGEARSAHASAHYEAQGTRDGAPALGPDPTARHDGSTPAG